jgi:hypothetical protein
MIRISIHRAVRGIAATLSFGSVDFEDDLRGLERPVLLSAMRGPSQSYSA